jgi:hypothetical protein
MFKFLTISKIILKINNFRPILIGSIIISQKFIEDYHYNNVGFSKIFRIYDLKKICKLERSMLKMLDYCVNIPETRYKVFLEYYEDY